MDSAAVKVVENFASMLANVTGYAVSVEKDAKDATISFDKVLNDIIGDIYDRGKGPHVIMDTLTHYHSVDIQWGNHDVVWMGAASGHMPCIATVIRIAARYGNLDTIEEGYGINLIPLVRFAMEKYGKT